MFILNKLKLDIVHLVILHVGKLRNISNNFLNFVLK